MSADKQCTKQKLSSMYQSDYVTHLEGYIKHQYALQHWPKFLEGSLKFVFSKDISHIIQHFGPQCYQLK